jgi:protein CpxP
MKRIAAAMVMVMLLATAALAAQEKGPAGHEGFGPGHGKGLVKMLEQLNLTPEQKHKVAQILKDNREQSKGLREAMKTAHEGMREVMDKTPGDEAAVRKAAQAMAKAGEELAVNMGKVKAAIDAVLTPEQKAKKAELRAAFKDRFKDRMEKHHGELDAWIEQNLKK